MNYKSTRHYFFILIMPMALLLLAGCAIWRQEPALHLTTEKTDTTIMAKMESEAPVYTFSFDHRMDPAEDVKMYAPFLRYLEKATGYHFKMLPMAPNHNLIDEMGNGQVDLAAIGTLSYLQAHQKYGVQVIARGITNQGKASYRALIITAAGSKIKSLQDLKGKTFAFGAETSTQGHLIPLIMLDKAGITLKDLAGYTFSGSHFDTANAVLSGNYAAGGIQDQLGRELANKGLVRILDESEDFPSSTISVSPRLPEDVVAKIQEALFAFDPTGQDKADLYHWEQTEMPLGFQTADDQVFSGVRAWAERLGLLSGGNK